MGDVIHLNHRVEIPVHRKLVLLFVGVYTILTSLAWLLDKAIRWILTIFLWWAERLLTPVKELRREVLSPRKELQLARCGCTLLVTALVCGWVGWWVPFIAALWGYAVLSGIAMIDPPRIRLKRLSKLACIACLIPAWWLLFPIDEINIARRKEPVDWEKLSWCWGGLALVIFMAAIYFWSPSLFITIPAMGLCLLFYAIAGFAAISTPNRD